MARSGCGNVIYDLTQHNSVQRWTNVFNFGHVTRYDVEFCSTSEVSQYYLQWVINE